MQEHVPFIQTPIGVVTHYWSHLGVAGVHLTAPLDVGDRIHIVGHTSNVDQLVKSIEVDHHTTLHADKNADVGIVVGDHVREHDAVYRILEPSDVAADQVVL